MPEQPWSMYAKTPQVIQSIQWEHQSHSIIIDQTTIRFTPTEYRVLCLLRHGVPVTYDDLSLAIYKCSTDDGTRIALEKHIDRIRGKLRKSSISIHCVLSYGYVLLGGAKENPQGSSEYDDA